MVRADKQTSAKCFWYRCSDARHGLRGRFVSMRKTWHNFGRNNHHNVSVVTT
jgi:hypothetical protein